MLSVIAVCTFTAFAVAIAWSKFMGKLLIAAAVAAVLTGAGSAHAQVYPAHPITIVVPSAAGGPNDGIVRPMAERMQALLGQPVLIDYVDGAAGRIGVEKAARAAPDGYTLCIGNWGNFVANGALYALPYDLVDDFAPIALLGESPLLIVAKKSMPAADLKDLVALLRASPDKFSSAVPGSGSHVASAFFQKETATRLHLVPYGGTGPAIRDLAAGSIDMAILNAGPALPQVGASAIKSYAVMAKHRMAVAPDIPTVDEAGLPGLYTSVWFGLWAPAKTPKDIIARLNAAVVEILAEPVVHARLAVLAQEVTRERQTPQALGAFQKSEIAKWWPIIKAAGINGE
jgi:tripartite-type tricarboxylate transporter receptor subunit TctC